MRATMVFHSLTLGTINAKQFMHRSSFLSTAGEMIAAIRHSRHTTIPVCSHILLPCSLSKSKDSCGLFTFLNCFSRRSAKYCLGPCWTMGSTQGPPSSSPILITSMLTDLLSVCSFPGKPPFLFQADRLAAVPLLAKPAVEL